MVNTELKNMVHIESIRIGNLLKKDGIIFKVTPVILIDIMRNPKDYEPVGIKEGLDKFLSAQDLEEKGGAKFVKGMCLIEEGFDYWTMITGIGTSIHVRTFHMLQNIYNAATNADLNIINCR